MDNGDFGIKQSDGTRVLSKLINLSYLLTEFVLFLTVLENFVMPMGLDSSHATLKET